MKEKPVDGMTTGSKAADNGWHLVEIGEGIDHIKNKEGVVYQDEKGNKAWKIPLTVKDDNDPSNGAYCDCSVFEANGGDFMATILLAIGVWASIAKAFPGDDVSVFDSRIMDKVKSKAVGLPLMVRTEKDKDDRPKVRQAASIARYKEILAEEKAKGKGKGKDEGGQASAKDEKGGGSGEAAASGDDW